MAEGLVFRVQGIPPQHSGRDQLKRLLSDRLRIYDGYIHVHSIAEGQGSSSKVATVSFTEVPSVLRGLTSTSGHYTPASLEGTYDITIDRHFFGLTGLHLPGADGSVKVFCIAVHGLGGHAFGSWKAKGRPFMWLRDAINGPAQIPGAVSVLFGYDSEILQSQSFQDVEDIASRFCEHLKLLVEKEAGSPYTIVFVAHSLGGIVLKEALNRLRTSSQDSYRAIASNVVGAIFLGVPNQGFVVDSLLAEVQGNPNSDFIAALKEGSTYLSNLQDRFLEANATPRSKIVYVYESQLTQLTKAEQGVLKPTDNFVRLLSRASATNGAVDSLMTLGLNKDHRSLIKFESEHDADYITILGRIRDIVTASVQVQQRAEPLVSSFGLSRAPSTSMNGISHTSSMSQGDMSAPLASSTQIIQDSQSSFDEERWPSAAVFKERVLVNNPQLSFNRICWLELSQDGNHRRILATSDKGKVVEDKVPHQSKSKTITTQKMSERFPEYRFLVSFCSRHTIVTIPHRPYVIEGDLSYRFKNVNDAIVFRSWAYDKWLLQSFDFKKIRCGTVIAYVGTPFNLWKANNRLSIQFLVQTQPGVSLFRCLEYYYLPLCSGSNGRRRDSQSSSRPKDTSLRLSLSPELMSAASSTFSMGSNDSLSQISSIHSNYPKGELMVDFPDRDSRKRFLNFLVEYWSSQDPPVAALPR